MQVLVAGGASELQWVLSVNIPALLLGKEAGRSMAAETEVGI